LSALRFLFRADGGISIGTGHVVRCATLAATLRREGHEVHFVSRELPGHLIGWLRQQGFSISVLPDDTRNAITQPRDAAESSDAIGDRYFDWLVVDHYALDQPWEAEMARVAARILAIDDLGRAHDCHLLLDQNYRNEIHERYVSRVPSHCVLLLGPQFALVRSEFAALRSVSLARLRTGLSRIVVFMGGTDSLNETTKALAGLVQARLAESFVDVVIGQGNPHRAEVEAACARLPKVELHIQTTRMAELLTAADLAICAGGSVTWERCVLGLPGMVVITAENQEAIARTVAAAGGHRLLGWHRDLTAEHYAQEISVLAGEDLRPMSAAAAGICDGLGVGRVADALGGSAASAHLAARPLHA
jgi:UDP-2,4-diacetamido-2,4,6-trideoxy-beta-L-altropyranose hydrolase